MLTPRYLREIIEATEKKVGQINDYLVSRIVDRIISVYENTGEVNINPASMHDALKMESAGKLFDEIQEELARRMPEIQKEVRTAFYDAAGKIDADMYDFTRKVIDIEHEKGELRDIPGLPNITDMEKVGLPSSAKDLNLTPKEIRMLESAYNRTNGEIYNITGTTASAAQQSFIDACDTAYWKIAHGVSSGAAITEAIEEVAAKGITTVHYGNRQDKIEVAIARAVRTGINQANGDIKLTRCAEMGVGYVVVSAHVGARVTACEDYTNHAYWQGKVYSLDWNSPVLNKYQPTQQEIQENQRAYGFLDKIKRFLKRLTGKKYEDFITSCGYGQMLGICGINCRHSFDPFWEGISINTWKPIDPKENKQRYELEQKQRAMERKIRNIKRQKNAFDNAESKDEQVQKEIKEKRREINKLLKQQREEYRQFCKDNRLSTDTYRLQIAKVHGINNTNIISKPIKIPEGVAKIRGMTEDIEKEIQKGFDDIEHEYNVQLNVDIKKIDPDVPFECIYDNSADTVKRCIIINSAYDFSSIQYIVEESNRIDYFAGRSIADYIRHEAAHYMTGLNITGSQEFERFHKTVKRCYVPGVSGYSDVMKDGFETIAEAFVKIHNGKAVPEEAKKLVIQLIERWKK